MSSPPIGMLDSALRMLGLKTLDRNLHAQSTDAREGLVSSIDDDLELLSALILELSDHHAKLRRSRNRLASKTRDLPVEVFQTIIAQSLPGWPETSDPARLETLRTVCSSWSEHILSNRPAWAIINHSYARTPKQVGVMLERSGNAPLSIEGNSVILDAALALIDRIEFLKVPYPQPSMATFLSQPMPKLRTLILGDSRYRSSAVSHFTDLFAGVAPCLRHVRATHLSTIQALHPHILLGLTELTLIVPEDANPSMLAPQASLGAIISLCPNLHSLEIWVVGALTSDDILREPFTIPSLQILKLHAFSSFLGMLVWNMSGPAPRQCFIEAVDDFPEPNSTIISALPFLNHPTPLTARVTESRICLQTNGEGSEIVFATRYFGSGRHILNATASSSTIAPIPKVELLFDKVQTWRRYAGSGICLPKGVEEVRFKLDSDTDELVVGDLALLLGSEQISLPASLRALEIWEKGQWLDRRSEVEDYIMRSNRVRGEQD